MSNETRFFKIGISVILSTLILVLAILFFGLEKYFRPTQYIETYFDESVQGLDEGSPVKYRGITIGHIDEIKLISSVYSNLQITNKQIYERYIYIRMAITEEPLKHFSSGSTPNQTLEDLIKSGLRVRIIPQGLTGTSYLEITFLDPKLNKPIELTWTPNNLYIPSASSAFTRFTDAIETILSSMQGVKFKELSENIDELVRTTQTAIEDANIPQLSDQIKQTMENFKQATTSYKKLADDINILMENSQLTKTFNNIADASEDLKILSSKSEKALDNLNSTLNNTNNIIQGYQFKIGSILDNADAASQNFKAASNNLKEYPSQLLWGKTPPHLDPAKIQ